MSYVRTRAFAAFSRLFQLPGTESLGVVDFSVATPVVQLDQIIRSGVAEVWSFARQFIHAGAAVEDASLDPFGPDSSGQWSSVWIGNRELLNGVQVLPPDWECLVTQFGVGTSADVLTASLVFSRPDSVVARAISTVWHGDTSIDTGTPTSLSLLRSGGASPYLRTLPWWLTNPSLDGNRPFLRARSTGAVNFTASMTVLAAPVGVLRPR